MASKQKSNNLSVLNDTEEDKKRKREDSSVSSISELELSISKDINPKGEEKTKKKKNKKSKKQGSENTQNIIPEEDSTNNSTMTLQAELKAINEKLSNVITKDDDGLRNMIKEMINEMKEELIKSMERKIEVLESQLMDKQLENDKLNITIKDLNKKIDDSADETSRMKKELNKNKETTEDQINQLEQYSRRNNLRIEGMKDREKETVEETMKTVVEKIHEKMPEVDLTTEQIDIAHRIGKYTPNKPRTIIVKLQSRVTKQRLMKNKRNLKGTGIFINEDLTKKNQEVLASVRRKQPDIVVTAWSYEGRIFYKDVNDSIQEVRPQHFSYWTSMPWPEKREEKAKR